MGALSIKSEPIHIAGECAAVSVVVVLILRNPIGALDVT